MEKNMDTKFDFNETGRFDFKQGGEANALYHSRRLLQGYGEEYPGGGEGRYAATRKDSAESVKVQPKKRPVFKMIWAAAIAVAASVAVLLVLIHGFSSAADSSLALSHSSQPSQAKSDLEQVDQAFATQLSEADQAYLLDVYQEDVFLNN